MDENWRHMKKVRAMVKAEVKAEKAQKAQKARDVQEARDKMKKERVDASSTRTYTWTGKLRHSYSSVLTRRPRRVAPTARTEALALSAASGTCLKQADPLGGSGGAAGTSVAATVLIPNLTVRCLLEHV